MWLVLVGKRLLIGNTIHYYQRIEIIEAIRQETGQDGGKKTFQCRMPRSLGQQSNLEILNNNRSKLLLWSFNLLLCSKGFQDFTTAFQITYWTFKVNRGKTHNAFSHFGTIKSSITDHRHRSTYILNTTQVNF